MYPLDLEARFAVLGVFIGLGGVLLILKPEIVNDLRMATARLYRIEVAKIPMVGAPRRALQLFGLFLVLAPAYSLVGR